MKCSLCREKIQECDGCGEPFNIDDEVICDVEGHFCDPSCAGDWDMGVVEK